MADFSSGFESGANIILSAKRLKQDKELTQKRLDFEAEQKKKEIDNQTAILQKRLDFEAGEGAKNRTQQTSLQQGAQGFQGSQADLDRQQRIKLAQDEMAARAALQQGNLGSQQAMFDKEHDPASPINAARLDLMKAQAEQARQRGENPMGSLESVLPDGAIAKIPMGAAALQKLAAAKAAGGDVATAFPKEAEGRTMVGPDGKRYIIKDGKPVPVK